jgi:hypothetical protein
MRKSVLLMALVAVAMLLANLYGCGQDVATKENEGLSREEEKELEQRLEELEKEIESEDKAAPQESASQPEQTEQQSEDDVWKAAEAYYRAVSSEDWAFTYNTLDSQTRSLYTKDEWSAKNQWFADRGSVTFDILSVELDASSPEPIADVSVGLTYGDGTTSTRLTYFVYENGSWKHRFGEEENDLFMPDASYEEFVAAQGGTASPSATESAANAGGSSPPASPGSNATATDLKHVKVVISSDVPVDISIADDNANWIVAEQISGTKTYENDIASDSGLIVDAFNAKMRGNVSIKVYENGQLKTQDSDTSGYAQVIY